jgi:hypothetical protein
MGRGLEIDVARDVGLLTVGRPRLHALAPLFQRVAAVPRRKRGRGLRAQFPCGNVRRYR